MMAANSRRRRGNKRFVWTIAMIASEAILFAEGWRMHEGLKMLEGRAWSPLLTSCSAILATSLKVARFPLGLSKFKVKF
jgi:hypothetical protein